MDQRGDAASERGHRRERKQELLDWPNEQLWYIYKEKERTSVLDNTGRLRRSEY